MLSAGDPPLYSGNGYDLAATNATTQIWTIWNLQQQPNAGTGSTIWGAWMGGLGGGPQTTPASGLLQQQQIWTTWVNTQIPTTASSANYPPLTEEELARQRDDVARVQAEEKAANERAAELLLTYLDDDQKRTWRENNVIDLVSEGKKRYRIKRGVSHNVTELNEHGKEVVSYCAHPDGVPVDDVVLTQILALKYAEDHFLKVANKRQLAA